MRNRSQTRERKRKTFQRRKVCRFCADSSIKIDFRDAQMLRYFITERGKIIPRRISGTCAWHQRKLTIAIKRSRQLAMLPYTATPLGH